MKSYVYFNENEAQETFSLSQKNWVFVEFDQRKFNKGIAKFQMIFPSKKVNKS